MMPALQKIRLVTKAWFGDEDLTIDFPSAWNVVMAGPPDQIGLREHELREALCEPIGTPRLSELAKARTRAAILVDDLTRPTPADALLPLLVEELKRGGIPDRAITIVIAGGTHPPATREEIAKKVGVAISSAIMVVAHDCRRDLAYCGRSPAGLPLHLNRAVMECDLKIGVGCIYPHPFAGFSGGAKIILPAACGVETTRMMHDYLRGSRERGGSIHTELRQDMLAVARQVGLQFIVNVTLNQHRQICGLFAGDVVAAHEKGVRYAKALYHVPPMPDADVVVADMYPFDTSWQFAHDRGMWPLERAKREASRVVVAACPLGLGTHELFPIANPLWARIGRRIRHFRLADLQRPFEKVKAAVHLIQQKQHRLKVLSPGLKPEELKKVFPHAQLFSDWNAIRSGLLVRHGQGPVKVVVYRCAPLLIPSLSDRQEGPGHWETPSQVMASSV